MLRILAPGAMISPLMRGTRCMSSTIDQKEVEHFSRLAKDWWDPQGSMKSLHEIHPVRMREIRHRLCEHFDRDADQLKPLENLRILDAGCGCGLLSESLARLGATAVGADPSESISVAREHMKGDPSLSKLTYVQKSLEQLCESEEKSFDAVISLEVIEHVADPSLFVHSISRLLKDDGTTIISTINRTPQSLLFVKWAAEYVLGWIPKGSHDWNKFITPDELQEMLQKEGLTPIHTRGMTLNLPTANWQMGEDTSTNYLIQARVQ